METPLGTASELTQGLADRALLRSRENAMESVHAGTGKPLGTMQTPTLWLFDYSIDEKIKFV